MSDKLRREKGYPNMLSGKLNVHIQLEDEISCPDEHVAHIHFIGDSMSDMIMVEVVLEDKGTGKSIRTGVINITRHHFNGICTQLSKMKSILSTIRGENK